MSEDTERETDGSTPQEGASGPDAPSSESGFLDSLPVSPPSLPPAAPSVTTETVAEPASASDAAETVGPVSAPGSQPSPPPARASTDAQAPTVGPEGTAPPAQAGGPPRDAGAGEGLPASPISGYEVLQELGRGGMAVVYKARQTSLDRIVALKVMAERLARDPDFVARFEREAKALAALNHPNIVAIHDRGQAGDHFYFVMEFVEGYSLRDVLQEVGGKLPVEWALSMLVQVADALAYTHRQGTIHRDIKPENVLVNDSGLVKVSDFGLAGMLDRDASGNLTTEGAMMGTLNYMAPEQGVDAARVTHKADLYSFGVMLYECLTGQVPRGRFQPACQVVPGLDPGLDALVEACLQTDPARRPPNADAVAADLREVEARVHAAQQAAAAAAEAPEHDDQQLEDAMARLAKQAEEDEARAAEAAKREAEKPREKLDPELERTAADTDGVRWDVIFGFFGEWTEAILFGLALGVFLLLGGFEALFPKDIPEGALGGGPGGITVVTNEDGTARGLKESSDASTLTTEEQVARLIDELAEEPVEVSTAPLEMLLSEPLSEATSLTAVERRILELQPDPEDKRAVLAALKSTDPLQVVAALRLEEAGKLKYSVKMLDKMIEFNDDPMVQETVVELLARRAADPEDQESRGLLVDYVDRARGKAVGYALAHLREKGIEIELPERVRTNLLLDAAMIDPSRPETLRAVRDLAALDGAQATLLLKRLRADRSAAVSRVATMAWEFRVRMGLVEGKRALTPEEIAPPDLEFFEELEGGPGGGGPPPEPGSAALPGEEDGGPRPAGGG